MCMPSAPKPPPPMAPPPPPAPGATELEEPGKRKKGGAPSDLDALRRPLNPTGLDRTPRLGL